MLSFLGNKAKVAPQVMEVAHLLINEQGRVLSANQDFVDLTRTIIHKRLTIKDIVGKTVKEVFGRETNKTFVGIFMKKKRATSEKIMVDNRLYQVVVEEIIKGKDVLYEFFYLPIHAINEVSGEKFLQNVVQEMAVSKGFAGLDWVEQISDSHCKQLISCLLKHEHTTVPERYCPYKHRCGFNPTYGSSQLDRRAYHRIKVNFLGELYLKALKDRDVPTRVAKKKIIVQAMDLSMVGIKILVKGISVPEESIVELVFEEFAPEGVVVWNKKAGENWLTGIRFRELDNEQQRKLIKAMTKRRTLVKL